ncbi:FAD-dependent oxidoreductase [Collinsella sp. zg1085]|uniref:NAD(P)/FAD-dependent oxidoreductase n=1 Tax=Collinsella sp. zg1085 TaxID=2844380 RepID=UPI001C0BF3CB|nr:FAD-dependent monooxygenase [Collinsella sp. zg1085]QWT17231.1 FAD-dependent oxidoreductase [Collinsella sp. zg1085]
MIEVQQLIASLDQGLSEEALRDVARAQVVQRLGISDAHIQELSLHRVSVDARKKRDVHLTLSAYVDLNPKYEQRLVAGLSQSDARLVRLCQRETLKWERPQSVFLRSRPVVIGAGCAGLFAGFALAEAGLQPLIIERGDPAYERAQAIETFKTTLQLDPESNIQFGLGGAGTFSDGKLTTGTKSAAHQLILQSFVEAGAPREILWQAKPHIGSDILPNVVTQLVKRIQACGGEIRFRVRLTDIELDAQGALQALCLTTATGEERIATKALILSCGHSARDIFALLQKRGIALARKSFAMGVRIEHKQADIDKAQYGPAAGHPALGAAPYKLVAHVPHERTLFSFCMCPGGEVVAAASEQGRTVTNGASLYARAKENANAALLVNVNPGDLPGDDVLAGIVLQAQCEKAAYQQGLQPYQAPAQLVGDFLAQRSSSGPHSVHPSYPLGVTWSQIEQLLPQYIISTLRHGLPMLGNKLKPFSNPDAVLTAVESRSSSPVTILRDANCCSISTPGLYPAGEGAGYAGGIMSAAADGIRVAQALIEQASHRS